LEIDFDNTKLLKVLYILSHINYKKLKNINFTYQIDPQANDARRSPLSQRLRAQG
jgi:hypothetical protein